MKLLLLNDTTNYHNGCKQVIKNLKLWMQPYKVVISIPISVPRIAFDEWDSIDAVVVNGEGTMHNNRQGAVSALNFIKLAQQQNKPTVLLNSIWQNIDPEWKTVTDKLVYWSVRDVYSQLHATKDFKRTPALYPDLSYFGRPDNRFPKTVHDITLGQSFDRKQDFGSYPQRINIFDQPWDDIVNQLRNSNLCVTGRFHEVMASIRADKPFVAIEGNSWKMQALIASAGANIPVLKEFPKNLQDVKQFVKTYDNEYYKVLLWHKHTTLPSFACIL